MCFGENGEPTRPSCLSVNSRFEGSMPFVMKGLLSPRADEFGCGSGFLNEDEVRVLEENVLESDFGGRNIERDNRGMRKLKSGERLK